MTESPPSNRRKTAVIGGSGFIGTRLVRMLLEKGHEVVIPDIQQSETYPDRWVECDVREPEQLEAALSGVDVVYNLAAAHRDDVRPIKLYYDVNVEGARQLAKVATKLSIRTIIFTSSVAIYGLPDEELDESAPSDPFNDYGHSKIQAEDVLREWEQEDQANRLLVVRPTVVFGETNRANFYSLANQIVTRRFLMIGSGTNQKSIAYVENVASFLSYLSVYQGADDTFNYVDKPDFTVKNLVNLIRQEIGQKPLTGPGLPYWLGYMIGAACDGVSRLTGRSLPLSRVRVKKFCSNSQFSAGRALQTGFTPPFSLEQGVSRTLAFEWPEQHIPSRQAERD